MNQIESHPVGKVPSSLEHSWREIALPTDILEEFSISIEPGSKAYEAIRNGANDVELKFVDLEMSSAFQYKWGCLNLGKNHSGFFSAASDGYPQGQYALARLLESGYAKIKNGEAEQPDLLAAAYWYQQAAIKGHILSVGKCDPLLTQVLNHAKIGDPGAMFDIGSCFETGIFDFFPKDTNVAISWFQQAAEAGSTAAHRVLAEIYCCGAYGIPQNSTIGLGHLIEWVKSIQQGNFDTREGSKYMSLGVSGYGLYKAYLCIFELAQEGSDEHAKLQCWLESDWRPLADEDKWKVTLLKAIFAYLDDRPIDDVRALLRLTIKEAEGSLLRSGLDAKLDEPSTDWGWPFHDEYRNRRFANPNQARSRRIESALRRMSQKDVPEATVLLGLILIGTGESSPPDLAEGKARLESGANNGDLLSALYLVSLVRSGRISTTSPTELKSILRRVAYSNFDEGMLEGTFWESELNPRKYNGGLESVIEEDFQKLRQDAIHELKEIELEEAVHQAKEQAQRDMLSYLTHTLNNTLSSGPEAARQAMRILGSELYENNREYKAINNIAAMFSTFLFAQQLLKTFKLYIADPDMLRQNWVGDTEGDASITVVLALALRQTLSQVVFSANHQAALQRLLPHKESGAIKATRKSFMEEIVPLDVDAGNATVLFDWVESHLGAVTLSIDTAADLHFRSNSTRFTFFFSSFSELIYNALKYSDGARPIEVAWEKSGDNFVFRCSNAWTEESLQSAEGSGKGLLFLTRLVDMLGASLHTQRDAGMFVAEIRFPEKLIKGA